MSSLLAALAPDVLATLGKLCAALLPLLAGLLAGRKQVEAADATETARIKDAQLQAALQRPVDGAALTARLRAGKF
jgi:hypothetical protein